MSKQTVLHDLKDLKTLSDVGQKTILKEPESPKKEDGKPKEPFPKVYKYEGRWICDMIDGNGRKYASAWGNTRTEAIAKARIGVRESLGPGSMVKSLIRFCENHPILAALGAIFLYKIYRKLFVR